MAYVVLLQNRFSTSFFISHSAAFKPSMNETSRAHTNEKLLLICRVMMERKTTTKEVFTIETFLGGMGKSKENGTSHLLNLLCYVQRVSWASFSVRAKNAVGKSYFDSLQLFSRFRFSRTNTFEELRGMRQRRLDWLDGKQKESKKSRFVFHEKNFYEMKMSRRKTFRILPQNLLFTFDIFRVVKTRESRCVCAVVFVQFFIDLIITTRCFNFTQLARSMCKEKFKEISLRKTSGTIRFKHAYPDELQLSESFSLTPEKLLPLAKTFSIHPVWKSCA